jgi:hypothetical protein
MKRSSINQPTPTSLARNAKRAGMTAEEYFTLADTVTRDAAKAQGWKPSEAAMAHADIVERIGAVWGKKARQRIEDQLEKQHAALMAARAAARPFREAAAQNAHDDAIVAGATPRQAEGYAQAERAREDRADA